MQDVFAFLENLGYRGEFFSPNGLLPLEGFDGEIPQGNNSERFWDSRIYCNNFLVTIRA